jgi:beta-lactamase regulating signal transducer with metallopeptidase domain
VDALLNWLWQGILPALALSAFVMVCGPRLAANLRFRLWWLALAAILIAPVLTIWFGSFEIVDRVTPDAAAPAPMPLPEGAQATTPIVIALWAAASLIAIIRVAISLVRVSRAKRACLPFPARRELALRHWNAIRGTDSARLMLSNDVRSAAVLGVWSPVIAVNPLLARALDDAELDQIVMHEWAHIKRRDHSLNAIERLILAVFGGHPAIWWVGRQLRLEREAACDDRVVTIVGSRKQYAACLLKLGTIAGPHTERLPAPAALSTPQLTTRIHRLLDVRRQETSGLRLAGSLGAALVVLTTATVANIELVGLAQPLMAPAATVIPGVAADSTGTGGDSNDTVSSAPQPKNSRPLESGRAGASSGRRQAIATPSVHSSSTFEQRPDAKPGQSATQPAPTSAAGSQEQPRVASVVAEPLTRLELARSVYFSPEFPTSEAKQGQRSQTPWGAAADTGVAVGRGSQKAAVATAGFFTRVSKSVAGAFVPGGSNKPKE